MDVGLAHLRGRWARGRLLSKDHEGFTPLVGWALRGGEPSGMSAWFEGDSESFIPPAGLLGQWPGTERPSGQISQRLKLNGRVVAFSN